MSKLEARRSRLEPASNFKLRTSSGLRATFLLALSLLLAACGAKGTSGLAGPQATVPPAPTPASTPDARSVDVQALVPEGATVDQALYGPLLPKDGDQIVVQSSRALSSGGKQCSHRQDYLQVFSFDRNFGDWKPLFEADRWPSTASPFIPDRGGSSDPCKGYDALELVALADLERDNATQELVVAVATANDTPGPLFLKVLSFWSGAAESIYDEATTRGGGATLTPNGDVQLEQDTYPPRSSPLWRGRGSPNGTLTETIGWDETYAQVDVLKSAVDLYCRHGTVDQVKDEALIVTCDSDGRRQFTGYRVTGETRVLPEDIGGLAGLRVGQEVSVSPVEPLTMNEDWELEPVAAEVRALTQRPAVAAPDAIPHP